MLNIWRKTRKPPVDNPKRNAFFGYLATLAIMISHLKYVDGTASNGLIIMGI